MSLTSGEKQAMSLTPPSRRYSLHPRDIAPFSYHLSNSRSLACSLSFLFLFLFSDQPILLVPVKPEEQNPGSCWAAGINQHAVPPPCRPRPMTTAPRAFLRILSRSSGYVYRAHPFKYQGKSPSQKFPSPKTVTLSHARPR